MCHELSSQVVYYKRRFSFMNNLYHKVVHKVVFASVCTALAFAFVANKEAKAVAITLTPTTSFIVGGRTDQGGLANYVSGDVPLSLLTVGILNRQEFRAFYEFNIANLSLAPHTAISSAIFEVKASSTWYESSSRLDAHGYIGNGQADLSDFDAGEYLDGRSLYSVINMNSTINPSPIFSFNVLPFISQIIKNNDTFAGFSFRSDEAYLGLNKDARLTIITLDVAEPVPEPTTIFGSALALSLGGWLKRKKSSQQNKTTSQN
jgi:hypothetical protein